MKALRAELAAKLIGGVVPVGAPWFALGAHWELWSGNGAAGTVLDPALTVIGCQVSKTESFADQFWSPFHICSRQNGQLLAKT